jgi:hypothetical protein
MSNLLEQKWGKKVVTSVPLLVTRPRREDRFQYETDNERCYRKLRAGWFSMKT